MHVYRCYFSKCLQFCAMHIYSCILVQIFMRMGLPRVILSDNGSEFCTKLNDELAEILGVKRRLTTPYHPQVGV